MNDKRGSLSIDVKKFPSISYWAAAGPGCVLELDTNLRKVLTFTIMEKAPTGVSNDH